MFEMDQYLTCIYNVLDVDGTSMIQIK